MMRLTLMCLALVIACSGVVQAAEADGFFVPLTEKNSKEANRWKTERKSSYRPSAGKRPSAASRDDADATAETEKDTRTVTATADDSSHPWAVALLVLGGLVVTVVLGFLAVRVRQARTTGRRPRDRSSAPLLLTASLVQARMQSAETSPAAQEEEREARRAA